MEINFQKKLTLAASKVSVKIPFCFCLADVRICKYGLITCEELAYFFIFNNFSNLILKLF